MKNDDKYFELITQLLRPIARLSISNSIKFAGVQSALKAAFIQSAKQDFPIIGKKVTTSRVSLITGLQRRDITEYAEGGKEVDAQGKLVRLHSHLCADGRKQIALREFEAIARSLYQDIHPRTFTDELLRLNLIAVDEDVVIIHDKTFIDHELVGATKILADNMTAHFNVAVDNILGGDPQMEQAVYATALHQDDADELEQYAREYALKLQQDINTRAVEMQEKRSGSHQIRLGVYFENRENQDE